MGLWTHLQSHSWELMDAGTGSNRSAICRNKNQMGKYPGSLYGGGKPFFPYAELSSLDGGNGFIDPGEKGFVLLGSEVG